MDNTFNLDLSDFSNELKLILEILKMEKNENTLLYHKEFLINIDWNLFLQLVKHHRVFPIIYLKLKRLDQGWIPSYVVQALYDEYQKNTFRMLHLSGETEQISKIFTENSIRTLFLKGPVLAADLYGDISYRTSADLDVLIPINELNHAEKILLKLGYVKDDYILTVLNDWKWRHHHITYFHPEKRIKLEIHWRLNPGPAKEPRFNELWDRKRLSSLTSYPVYVLGREDLFIFLVSHGARHGWSRLRWLTDIDRLIKQELNWKKLTQLIRKYQYLHLGGQAIILTSQLLNTPVFKEMNKLIVGIRSKQLAECALFYFKQMINLHNIPLPDEVAKYHKRHLFSLMSAQQKLLFMMSFFYPYPEDAEILPLPKNLHFLYFPLRPFLWLWRKTKEQAVS